MARWKKTYEDEFEAKIEYRSSKAILVECTLGGRYWIPISCIDPVDGMEPSDFDGNYWLKVSQWWTDRKDQFDATRPRE